MQKSRRGWIWMVVRLVVAWGLAAVARVRATGATHLPGDRSYELVSPPPSTGGDVLGQTGMTHDDSADVFFVTRPELRNSERPLSGYRTLRIKTTPDASFEVSLFIQVGWLWNHIVSILNGDTVNSLVNLQTLLIGGGSVGGLVVWTLRRWWGRKRERVTPSWDEGTVVEVDDLLRLHESLEMRKGDGAGTHYVVILDERFLGRLRATSDRLGRGDRLRRETEEIRR